MSDVECPKYLYKFRDWKKEKHRSILQRNEFFFSSFCRFDDPWDSRLPLRHELMEFGERVKYFYNMRRNHEPTESAERSCQEAIGKAKQYDNPAFSEEDDKRIEDIIADNYGILSLSGTYSYNLLWSHYANGHKGICLQFDNQILDSHFDHIYSSQRTVILGFRVKYGARYKEIIPSSDSDEFILDRFRFKSRVWEYETEYRYILQGKSNTVVSYPTNALRKVILGCRIENQDKEEVLAIVRSRFPECKVDQAEKQFGTFDLQYKSII